MAFEGIRNRLSESFERLNAREKIMVSGGGIMVVIMGLGMVWILLSQSVETLELSTKAKTKQLQQLVELQSTYNERTSKSRRLKAKLRGNRLRLVPHIESAAKQAGISIGNMTPREAPADEDGIKETSVSIRLQKLSITRLQDFLKRIETTTKGIVRIKRLRMRKRYDDKTLLDVEMSIATYKSS